jgi:hypothetical protein
MKNNIYSFVKKYWKIGLVIFLILFLIINVFEQFSYKNCGCSLEGMDNISNKLSELNSNKCIVKNTEYDSLLGKQFYLIAPIFKRDENGDLVKDSDDKNVIDKFVYLTHLGESDCVNKFDDGDCLDKMGILKEIDNLDLNEPSSLFTLVKPPFQDAPERYLIEAYNEDETKTKLNLSQQIFVTSDKKKLGLCFDSSAIDFSLMEPIGSDDGSFMIKMTYKEENKEDIVSYVGKCTSLSCMTADDKTFSRICSYSDEDLNNVANRHILKFYMLLAPESCDM